MSFLDGFQDSAFSSFDGEMLRPIQIINPKFIGVKEGISAFGLGYTVKDCVAANFEPPKNWFPIEHKFSSSVEKMYVSQNPRLAIVAKTPIYVRHIESNVITLLKDTPEFYQNKTKYKRFNYDWVFVLDENNNRTHPTPLAIKAQGASGTVFNLKWLDQGNTDKARGELRPRSGLCFEIEKAFASATKTDYQFKNNFFHAHCIYDPQFEAEKRGVDGNENLCAIVTDYSHPTAANLEQFLIPAGSEFSQLIAACQEEYKNWQPRKLKAVIAQTEQRQREQDDFDYYEQQERNVSSAYTSIHPMQPQFSAPPKPQRPQSRIGFNNFNSPDDIPF
jgi:Family of unknown function (DUF5895)